MRRITWCFIRRLTCMVLHGELMFALFFTMQNAFPFPAQLPWFFRTRTFFLCSPDFGQWHQVCHRRNISCVSSPCPCKNLVFEQVTQSFVTGLEKLSYYVLSTLSKCIKHPKYKERHHPQSMTCVASTMCASARNVIIPTPTPPPPTPWLAWHRPCVASSRNVNIPRHPPPTKTKKTTKREKWSSYHGGLWTVLQLQLP